MSERIKNWVRQQMTRRRMTQHDLARHMQVTQQTVSLRLAEGEKAKPFTLEELERLEDVFDEPSPIRYVGASRTAGAIDKNVLRGVIRHIAQEYPQVLRANPDKFADVVLDLCEYVQDENKTALTKAESNLAMKRVAVPND